MRSKLDQEGDGSMNPNDSMRSCTIGLDSLTTLESLQPDNLGGLAILSFGTGL